VTPWFSVTAYTASSGHQVVQHRPGCVKATGCYTSTNAAYDYRQSTFYRVWDSRSTVSSGQWNASTRLQVRNGEL